MILICVYITVIVNSETQTPFIKQDKRLTVGYIFKPKVQRNEQSGSFFSIQRPHFLQGGIFAISLILKVSCSNIYIARGHDVNTTPAYTCLVCHGFRRK